MKLYHIDRKKSLKPDQILQINKFQGYNDIVINGINQSDNLNAIIADLFSNELSDHGMRYLAESFGNSSLAKLEFTYELFRRIKYPNCPSRYKSFFAVEKKDIYKCMDMLRTTRDKCDIYEVESKKWFKADMTLLKGDGRLFDIIYAKKYWQQEESSEPMYEYLLEYPVKILNKVENINI